MKPELEAKLQREFPFMRPLPRKGRRFVYPLDFGIECGDGWYQLIRELCRKIQAELDKMPKEKRETFCVFQVKEKFGGLRFYVDWGNDAMYKAIDDAEEKSFETCEVCGRRGRLGRVGGWYMVRCGRCAKKDFVPVELEKEGNITTIDNSVATLKIRVNKQKESTVEPRS